MTLSIVSGEREVERVFRNEFRDEDFDWWNGHVGEDIAKKVIRNVGPATRVHVNHLIQDLWTKNQVEDSGGADADPNE